MQSRKNFIAINEGFTCENCGTVVPPAKATCRNHCLACLTSKHVDDKTPGDRASNCHGLMVPVRVEGVDPETLDIIHECTVCKKQQRNKRAIDDNQEILFGLMVSQ